MTEDIKNCILQNSNFIIAGHIDPDFDTIFSTLALQNLLRKLNKNVVAVNNGPFNKNEFVNYKKYFITDLKDLVYDDTYILIIVDCSGKDRIGIFGELIDKLTTIVVDHHSSGEINSKYNFIDVESPSTTVLIKRLFDIFKIKPDFESARMMIHGFCTDTGFFKYLKTNTGKYLRDIADLTDCGHALKDSYNEMHNGKSLNSRLYLATMIKKTKFYCDKKIALIQENSKISKKFQNDKDTYTLYDLIMSIENCELIIHIKHKDRKKCVVGLRAKHNIDVGKLAFTYGGGGHKAAAGFTYNGSQNKIKKILLNEFSKNFQ